MTLSSILRYSKLAVVRIPEVARRHRRHAVLQRQDVSITGEVVVLQIDEDPLRADRGGLVIVEVEPRLEREPVLDPDVEECLAGLETGLQLGIDARDARVLEEQLKSLLQLVDVQRRPRGQRESPREVAGAKPSVAFDLDAGQAPLDDLV